MSKQVAKTIEDAERMAAQAGRVAAPSKKPWPPPPSEWTVAGQPAGHVAHLIGYANTDQGKIDPRAAEAAIYYRGLATGKSPDRADNMTSVEGTPFGNELKQWEEAKNPAEHDPYSAKLAWLKRKYPELAAGQAAKFFSRPVIEHRGGPGVGDEGYEPCLVEGKEVRVGDQVLYLKPLEIAKGEEREHRAEQRRNEGLATSLNGTVASVEAVAQGASNPMSVLGDSQR